MAPTLKPMPYDYDDELARVRVLIRRCSVAPSHKPEFDEIQGLVILMEEFLRTNGYTDKDYRRDIRLGVLSLITGRRIETTYDLMAIEVRTIRNFFTSRDTGEITQLGEIFLIDLAGRAKGRIVAAQRPLSIGQQ